MSLRKSFYRGSLIALLLSSGMLSGCLFKVEQLYFDIDDASVAEADWEKPDDWSYKGDKVPTKTTIDWNGEDVHFLNDPENCCGPHVKIHSAVPLSNVIVTGALYEQDGSRHDYEESSEDLAGCISEYRYTSKTGENIISVSWQYAPESFVTEHGLTSCIRIGDEITIKLVPANGSAPLLVNATLVRSGYYWRIDAL